MAVAAALLPAITEHWGTLFDGVYGGTSRIVFRLVDGLA